MEMWEVAAREAIRDLATRYNANGDTGRFAVVRELFLTDAVMTIQGVTHTGIEAIMAVFSGTSESTPGLTHVRHFVATHQIDLIDESNATGRAYFVVLTDIGLDHWGRYVDEYRRVDGRWRFASRSVNLDGQVAASLFPRTV
ncbi:MAG: nuclear transport factor 2 family protein [Actinobacteria bacterium]|nr:nuclear transport factor 2 family protein [Actinomycetota bacterium]